MTLPEAVLRARLLMQADRSRLDLVTTTDPGRSCSIEGFVVHDRVQGLWLVLDDDALRLDETLWAAYHDDPHEELLGRVRVTMEAA